jgi:hypothetical protein
MLTMPKTCNGSGACSGGGSTGACPGNFMCNAQGTACLNGCAGSDANCAAGFYCDSNGNCQAKIANGLACNGPTQCQNGPCGTNNICCSATCTVVNPCGNSGACQAGAGMGGCLDFDTNTSCSATSCNAGTLTTFSKCDGNGSCAGSGVMTSCNGYTCNGNVCGTTCSGSSGCTATDTCVGTTCLLLPGQPCTSNAQCSVDVCDVDGTGNCCTAACTVGPTCGATSCDNTGMCVYPTTACGNTCPSGTNQHTPPGTCGSGTCSTMASACNANLMCASDGMNCLLGCGSNNPAGDANCVSGNYCDGAACQPLEAMNVACTRNGMCQSGNCNMSSMKCM